MLQIPISSSSSPTFLSWCWSLTPPSASSSSLPPTYSFPTNNVSRRRRKYPFRVMNSTKVEDDYHATLKALNKRGRTPRESLGQHYMLNSSVNDQLVSAADVKEGDVVLEIGPGTGS
ncbi:hypothetical protein C5167_049863 [Papaver somniferum]|uniref:rRNA adenine N(6)-methyltransferase n=2 Tax=Papaver somniferum TaxID=3469 RepID=A0A4Y7KM08_PAPSO|nr:hypothetical protein C5167_049863 [Papaver somniferum]